jgi:hypothetical protein
MRDRDNIWTLTLVDDISHGWITDLAEMNVSKGSTPVEGGYVTEDGVTHLDEMTFPAADVDLDTLDARTATIHGQLSFVDLRESGEAGAYVDIAIPGRRLPLTQWTRGDAQTFSFTAMIVNDPSLPGWSEAGPSVVAKYRNALKKAAAPHPRLKRPPLWRFTWSEIGFTCFVQSVSQIVYRDTDGRGRHHRATFEIDLKVVEDVLRYTPGIVYPQPERVIRDGETAEQIAKKWTKRPDLGVPLRQSQEARNQELRAFGRSGMIMQLVDGQALRHLGVAPRTAALNFARGDVTGSVATLTKLRAMARANDDATAAQDAMFGR